VRLVAAFGHRKARAMVRGQRDTWRILREKIDPTARYVWFHAASLGEFEQGLPLIERLRREQPSRKILLTFFSPSGYEVRKDYKGADVVCYLPFDSPTAARRFIKWARPEMAFFIKYEFWRNYIDVLSKKSIPVYSVSSIFRPGQIFFRWYGRKYARCLRRISHFFVQNERSVELLRTIGVQDNVTIVGDTRFDRVIDIRNNARPLPLVEQFTRAKEDSNAAPFVLVAGSSWQPDEDILLDYVNRHPDLRLVIAPHVVNDAHIQEIEQKLTTPALRYSQATLENVDDYRVLIIDGYGLLSSIYRYATVAYVGGGFGVGIHNVPEAAVYGIPVIIGPNHQRFAEAMALIANGGCKSIEKAEDFSTIMDDFLENPAHIAQAGSAAGDYIHQNAGATPVIYQHVFG
jgi:putative 3-deoxy-D-manno-octulosonic-acid transferase